MAIEGFPSRHLPGRDSCPPAGYGPLKALDRRAFALPLLLGFRDRPLRASEKSQLDIFRLWNPLTRKTSTWKRLDLGDLALRTPR